MPTSSPALVPPPAHPSSAHPYTADSAAAGSAAAWRRADLHCHSIASTEADEAVLLALQCPECYSEPADVYAQAKRRGMDFVTITDHDSLDGVATLLARPDVIAGEELTCYFPEDRCKMHVLVWGLTPAEHADLQARAGDIYAVAEYVEARRLAHAVAHPLYRQNDLIGRWHLERLLLMFKGFECLNGAHSPLHRDAFAPMLDELTEARVADLAAKHGLRPRWPQPWVKARVGGSDDHGLLNVGRTWTEFPPDVTTPAAVLDALRDGRCRPGGEAGSTLKLAHNFLSVGIKYHARNMGQTSGGPAAATTVVGQMLGALVGERPRVRRRDVVKHTVRQGMRAAGRAVGRALGRAEPPAAGTALLGQLALRSVRGRPAERAALAAAAAAGAAPLGEHEAVFRLLTGIDRDVTAGLAAVVGQALSGGRLAPAFDALSAVAAQQFALLPYYFALFHQNRERHLCGGMTGRPRVPDAAGLKVGLFTDTFDEVNGVARFLKRLGGEAAARDRHLTIATCGPAAAPAKPGARGEPAGRAAATVDAPAAAPAVDRVNFEPAVSVPFPHYPELRLSLPPVLEVLEWADRQQFDVVHISTPGPMGLVGWLVAKMLRVPVVTTYHTDFPAFVKEMTGDHRLATATAAYASWFYARADAVFARSRSYEAILHGLGVAPAAVRVLPPCTDLEAFRPQHRDSGLYPRLGVAEPLRLLYVGRVSREKSLDLLADAFTRLRATRNDVALVVVGDGPYLADLRRRLAGLPAHFLGYRAGAELSALYASADLFVFPSRTDTLGQAVVEAQASGLPAVVSDAGGPKEVMDDGVTGQVVAGTDPAVWADAIDDLLDDLPRRSRMSRTAAQRASRYTRGGAFEAFWEHHVRAVREAAVTDVWGEPPPRPSATVRDAAAALNAKVDRDAAKPVATDEQSAATATGAAAGGRNREAVGR